MLDYYIHDEPTAFRFQLAGTITGDGARRLEQVWCTASSLIGDRRRLIDITFVTDLDEDGRELLLGWHNAGARFVANSQTSRQLGASVLGVTDLEPSPEPRRALQSAILKSIPSVPLWLAALFFAFAANAANLKSETVAAWDNYLKTTQANLQARTRPSGCFLWTLESAERARRVRGGQIVVAPAPGSNLKNVPGGLIHHWIGAMFLPDVTIPQVLKVTRDYDRYRDYYQPVVTASRAIAREDAADRFSMRMISKALFFESALDADYLSTYVRLDSHRSYSISRTTRLQEIDGYGESGEHMLPDGQGSGYIWKLFSIARLDQQDGGVYVELEAIALSRDIPMAARFFIDPIVRRVSHNSILISLQQTRDALRRAPRIGTAAAAFTESSVQMAK